MIKANPENDINIFYAVGNTNTEKQENEIGLIIKKRNNAEWKFVSKCTEIVDPKNQFSNLYLLWEK